MIFGKKTPSKEEMKKIVDKQREIIINDLNEDLIVVCGFKSLHEKQLDSDELKIINEFIDCNKKMIESLEIQKNTYVKRIELRDEMGKIMEKRRSNDNI